MQEIVKECEEFGVLSEELRDRAYNTDYVALKELNERYELVFEKEDEKINRHTELLKVFDCFYQKHRSKTEEVCERIENETAYVIAPYVTRLDPDFAISLSNKMNLSREMQEKCRSYSEHIFNDYSSQAVPPEH